MIKIILTMMSTAMLVACQTSQKVHILPSVSVKKPIHFHVASIDTIISIEPTFINKSQEKTPYPELQNKLQDWIDHTFRTKAQTGTLLITVEQAQIKEKSLAKKTQGIKGYFIRDQSEVYHGVISVRLDIKDDYGQSKAASVTTVEHSVSVLENSTRIQKECEILRLMTLLITELDEKIRETILENGMSFQH